jgi:peptidoglycan/xylan/chitin deacetylase (PgdA/CDA1 family)
MLARLGISVLLAELLLTPLAGCSTRQLAVTKISIQESPFSDMTNKKVILRNDDVGDPVNATLKWLSDLVIEKDIKMTYAVMPKVLQDNPETLAYLRSLDSSRFEMGVHGYAHEQFETLSYDNQYALIKQATNLMKQFFSTDPRTFLPPFQSANIETTKVLKDLGYNTMASIRHYSDPYVQTDFAMNDFGWELTWSPVTFATFQDFVQAFDDFYERGQSQLGNDFFVIQSHHGAWVDSSGNPINKILNDYEKSIDYMKSKKVEFMTVEEGYEWVMDEPLIVVGVTDSNSYLIDLRNCTYNHPVRFNSPPGWGGRILIRDISTSGGISISKEGHMPGPSIEFNGERGHQYLIVNMVGSDQGDINLRPVLETIGNKLVNTGELLAFIISATDPNDDMLRYTASNLPPGASFDTQTHKFFWMATSRGPYSNVHFEVSDGQLTASEDINIRINLPPIITPIGIKEITVQQLLQFNISATDPDGDTLTYSASNLPSGASFNSSTRTFTWVPMSVGTYSNVHFEVSDGHMASSEDITIKVYHAGYQPPSVSFIAPTEADGATISRNSTEVNVSVAGSDDSSGFIDWNRSLVGYWPFDEGSGTTANDKSSYGSNGTLKNGPQWTTGKLGNALQFAGNGAYLEVPHNNSFNFGTGDFTIEFWIKNSQPLLNESYIYGIANKVSGGPNGVGWSCALRGGAYNGIYFRTEYPNYFVTEVIPPANYSSVVSDGNWHHFVITRSSGTVILYLDGNQIASKVADWDVTSSAPLYIGTFGGTSAGALNASLDEFRIWNRTLSQPEIKASYNAKVNPLTTTFTGLANGNYEYYAYAVDIFGNSTKTQTRTLSVQSKR